MFGRYVDSSVFVRFGNPNHADMVEMTMPAGRTILAGMSCLFVWTRVATEK
jgi:hypothetical protein